MGGSSKKQITGYIYRMAVHMGLCRGPIDELVEIQVDELTVWAGSITDDNDTSLIDKPDLFGGADKEGGLRGGFSVLMGKPTQDIATRTVPDIVLSFFQWWFGPNGDNVEGVGPPITNFLTGLVSSFRGVTTVFYRGEISANNPYPKNWRFRMRRARKGWQDDVCWYPEKAAIWLDDSSVMAMNPAHILYECMTNQAWGRGLSIALLDDGAWTAAANTLCDEGFGLCMRWSREEPIEDFMGRVIEHISAVVFVDRSTGLVVLRLIRDDYDIEDLPVFDSESGLLSVEADDSGASDMSFNEIVVSYTSPTDGKDRSIRAQNLAGFQSTGAVLTNKVEYKGLPTASLASRVALRDLRQQASGLKRYKLVLDRRGALLEPAGLLRLSDPSRGITDMVLRVGKIEEGTITEASVTVHALQDVFGLPATGFQAPQETQWESPDRVAIAADPRHIGEASYRDVFLHDGKATAEAASDTYGAIAVLAAKPSPLSMSYLLASRTATEAFEARDNPAFAPVATLGGALGPYDTAATFTDLNGGGYVLTGAAALIGNELVRIDAFDTTAGTLTLARGCGDTIPAPHASGVAIWFSDAGAATDGREYVAGEVVDVKVLTRTSSDTLSLDAAPTDSVTLAGRLAKPYPPGNVRVNTVPALAQTDGVVGDIVLSWAHRDRILQQDQLVEHGAPNVGPEPGTTYTVRVYAGAALLRTAAGITAATWTYDATMATADAGGDVLRFELESVRAGLASTQLYSFEVTRMGFDHTFDRTFNRGF